MGKDQLIHTFSTHKNLNRFKLKILIYKRTQSLVKSITNSRSKLAFISLTLTYG